MKAPVTVDPTRFVKPAVKALSAYTLQARPAAVKLNQNESPFDMPEAVKRRVLDAALRRPWSRYPEFDPKELLERLAVHSGWRADGMLAGNGSNELIEALLLVTVGPGARVLIPEPTFTLYALLTRVLGGEVVQAALDADLQYDAGEIRKLKSGVGAALTIVCSPNNPTGGVLKVAAIRDLCEESEGLVAIDEAYHEFSGTDVAPLLSEHKNLVVLRTFSKAMSMAGLRVGYLLAAPELVREINKARLPYNLNFFSQAAALAALDEWQTLRGQVEALIASREEVLHQLHRIPGVKPYPSSANFILFELLEADQKAVFESLWSRGILVRDVSSYPRLSRCLRVSIGSQEENEAFLQALRHALEEQRFRKAASQKDGRHEEAPPDAPTKPGVKR